MAGSGLRSGTDFVLGYSPERINPGDAEHSLEKVVKIIAAQDAPTLDRMEALYTPVARGGLYRASSIRTAAWDHRIEADPTIMDSLSRLYPLGRLVTPEEVANAALFLASPMASGISGAALNVDAGLLGANLPFVEAISGLGA